MSFRGKRSDTLVRSVEALHKVDLNVRGDMKLGTFLNKKGFASQSQFIKAYRGELTMHPQPRTAFISFHSSDFAKVQGLRLMSFNKALNLDIEEVSRKAVRSEDESYVRAALKRRIHGSDVFVCVVGNNTGGRDWVEWEIQTAQLAKIPICGIRIPGTYGRFPSNFQNAPVASWSPEEIVATIEMAIARG